MKLLGERVVVNARQANLTVELAPHTSAGSMASAATSSAVGVHLFAWHYDSLSPRAEVEALVKQKRLEASSEFQQGPSEPEQRYREERQLLLERRVVPLVVLPEYVGLSTSIRNWIPASWGEWRLADVWLDQGEAVTAGADHSSPKNSATVPVPGVKP